MRYDYVILCTFGWGVSVICGAKARQSLTSQAVIVFEALGAAVWLAAWIKAMQPSDKVLGAGQAWAVMAGVFGVLGTFGFYLVMNTTQLSRMVPLTSLYVVLPVLFGALAWRERLTPAQWVGVLLAFAAGYLLAAEPPERAGGATRTGAIGAASNLAQDGGASAAERP